MTTATMTTDTTLPAFFTATNAATFPAVARWAFDKVKMHTPHTLEVEGRTVTVRQWFFEGRMPRGAGRFYQQVDAPAECRQYTTSVVTRGGHYRGQRPTVLVCFTEYAATDGRPLPV